MAEVLKSGVIVKKKKKTESKVCRYLTLFHETLVNVYLSFHRVKVDGPLFVQLSEVTQSASNLQRYVYWSTETLHRSLRLVLLLLMCPPVALADERTRGDSSRQLWEVE